MKYETEELRVQKKEEARLRSIAKKLAKYHAERKTRPSVEEWFRFSQKAIKKDKS